MFNFGNFVKATFVGALLVVAPVAASAATISGQISIGGSVNLGTSDFSSGGYVDLNDPGWVVVATGDFGVLPVNPNPGSAVTLTDIDFDVLGAIWSVGGFTFTSTSYANIFDDGSGNDKGFTALGNVSHADYDLTAGSLIFTTQGPNGTTVSFSATTVVPIPAAGLLLMGALGGLGFVGRRRKKTS